MPRPAAASPGEVNVVHGPSRGIVHSPPVVVCEVVVVPDDGSVVGGGNVPVPLFVLERVAVQY